MATMYHAQKINVPAKRAWQVLEDYASAKNHIFSAASAERMERVDEPSPGRPVGDYRVVTVAADGSEIWELIVSTDPTNMRTCYTVPGLFGADHHNAYMQIIPVDESSSQIIWVTDVLPAAFADEFRAFYDGNFADIVKAVEQGCSSEVGPHAG